MQPYRFEFVHMKGETNKVADALSHTLEFECSAIEVHCAPLLYWDEIVLAVRDDPNYRNSKPKRDKDWRKEQGVWTLS